MFAFILPLTLIVFVVSFVFFGSNQENKLGNNSIYSVKDLFSFVSKTLEEEKVKQACFFQTMVGMDRLELSTSRLSVVRSNQLSYTPIVF